MFSSALAFFGVTAVRKEQSVYEAERSACVRTPWKMRSARAISHRVVGHARAYVEGARRKPPSTF